MKINAENLVLDVGSVSEITRGKDGQCAEGSMARARPHTVFIYG